MTENELIQGCINDNAVCQKAVFDKYASRLLGVCMRYARTSADAEDILQDSFIKIFGKIKQFKFEGSFEGWIRRITVNTALKKYTLLRFNKEIINYEITEKDYESIPAPVYAELSQKEIFKLINQLPEGYKVVFNLYVIEGYQHEEIAKMLGIQPGTSRSQLVKARAMLQKQILQLQKVAI